MPAYDAGYSPPAPVVPVRVLHPVSGQTSDPLPGKIDTGADWVIIPESTRLALNLEPAGQAWSTAYDGTRSMRPVYLVTLLIGRHRVDTQAIAVPRANVLIGRTVLRRFILTLNGKTETFRLRDP